ncbi:adenylate/guanylate cyclase domain-containing protein [Nitrososphaera sp. AFS]|uniref:adenylate/guanylate cyclase domain-containing protein n=1 Tax=Nitrososphaera sp. AFS TaxID=2301191 RepID=UPI00139235C8|nr:adenylate/guanylate cyclase domain-containing protein [Nitrososphaera sp. AFS]NAL77009.1 adenylate/guanylate cyclase domain-containing protein [Nitrososphaera sp. AFS]
MCDNSVCLQLGSAMKLPRSGNIIKRLMNPLSRNTKSRELNYGNPNPKYSEKILTVAFWDIKNFSVLCNILKSHPSLLVSFLREFLEMSRYIICKHDGTLDKFLGDGAMGIFGFRGQTKSSTTNAAICAVVSALQLRDAFNSRQSVWMKLWNGHVTDRISIGLKCGINTGYATTFDDNESVHRTQFTAVGNTVNIARRLTDICGSSQIIISGGTESKIRSQFEISRIGIVTDLKNIQGSYEIFNVVRIKQVETTAKF